jgi:hypothetical protein
MLLDSLRMRSLSDEEGGAGVSQVVNPEAFRKAGRPYRGKPDAPPEVAVPQRSPIR